MAPSLNITDLGLLRRFSAAVRIVNLTGKDDIWITIWREAQKQEKGATTLCLVRNEKRLLSPLIKKKEIFYNV